MDLRKLDDIKINFIIGIPRSGTTLVSVLLHQYPNCISLPEVHQLTYFYKKYKHVTEITKTLKEDIYEFIFLFYSHKTNPLFGRFNNSLIDDLKIGHPITYGQLIKLIYLGLSDDKGIKNEIRFIIDKNPLYTLEVDKILSIFPDAKFIALIRDYRAYALSNIESNSSVVSKKTTYYHALVWNLYLKYIERAIEKYGDQIKIIKYEDLILSKEITLKSIVHFFGLEFSESIFNYYESMKDKIKEIDYKEVNHKRMVKQITDLALPINTSRLETWRNNLSESDIKKIEYISSKYGYKYGYNPIAKINFTEKVFFSIYMFPDFIKVKVYEWLKSPDLQIYYKYKAKI